jgi:hypothetical protein
VTIASPTRGPAQTHFARTKPLDPRLALVTRGNRKIDSGWGFYESWNKCEELEAPKK